MMKNKYVAAFLGAIGGFFGLHKFYLGDPGAGIFYLFLSIMSSNIFPVAVLLGIIDALRLFMMPTEEFDRKFNNRYKGARRQAPDRRREVEPVIERRKGANSIKRRNNPFKKSGLQKYKEYDIEGAIEDFLKALKIDPRDYSIYFNLACAYSLMEDQEKAYEYVSLAVRNGFTQVERILSHDDLAYLRIQPGFDDFRASGFQRSPITPNTESEVELQQPMDDVLLAQLNRLMELRKKGVLTEQEFMREKKKVLAG